MIAPRFRRAGEFAVSLIFLASTFARSVDAQATADVNKTICFDRTSTQLDATAQQLGKAFTAFTAKVDLVVVVDTSTSISDGDLANSLSLIVQLIQYVQLVFNSYLDPDSGIDLEVITFGSSANISGTNINPCQLEDVLSGIRKPTADQPTIVSKAIDVAGKVFQRATNRRGLQTCQILFIITDGQFNDYPPTLVSAAVYRLRLWGVHVFSCGVGEWFNSAQEEQNLKSLTTDSSTDYLCMSDWMTVLTPKRNAGMRKRR